MNLHSDMSPLQRYLQEFPDIPGFFAFESMVIWDFLLSTQQKLGVAGNLLEIGVYKGRSAILAAMYSRAEETAVFVDIGPMPEAEQAIRRIRPRNNLFLQCRSADLLKNRELRDAPGAFRWCHVDGDHTGYSVIGDLEVAAYLVAEQGIICVDDFFNFRYPQLTAAVYQFLTANRCKFSMVFCGANKCYLCRSGAYVLYEKEIRNNFTTSITTYSLSQHQLSKSSYASDMGCFSLSWRFGDKADQVVLGMDNSPDEIVF